MRLTKTSAAAALWGLAEATIFFIVPDVLLSWVAIKNWRKALLACVWTLIGALAGGMLIWHLGQDNPDQVRSVFTAIPAISERMLDDVRSQLTTTGITALFIGPLIGTPYKIYALEAAHLGIGLGTFLLVSIPARMLRFLIVTAIAALVSHGLRKTVSIDKLRAAHVAVWTTFYAFYFYVMSGV